MNPSLQGSVNPQMLTLQQRVSPDKWTFNKSGSTSTRWEISFFFYYSETQKKSMGREAIPKHVSEKLPKQVHSIMLVYYKKSLEGTQALGPMLVRMYLLFFIMGYSALFHPWLINWDCVFRRKDNHSTWPQTCWSGGWWGGTSGTKMKVLY